jgi:monoterpene epsilon-lactone hydrolase
MKLRHTNASSEDKAYVEALLNDRKFQSFYSQPATVEAMRAANAALASGDKLKAVAPGVAIDPIELAGLPCECLNAPGSDESKIILFLHGGGFIRGSLELGRANAAELAGYTGVTVIAAAYRQAPEHPFPAATSDTMEFYLALLARGYAASDIVVVGESAGGCLALTLLPHLAREDMALPAGVAGISPMTDLRLSGAAWHFNALRDIATREMGERMLGLYIPADQRDDPLAAPVNSPVPPGSAILLCVGTHETMLSDVERYARHAEANGADVSLHLYEAMPHGFTKFAIPMARLAIADVAEWCSGRLYAS